MAWKATNKTDLIIEVWEKLDCESVGAVEIEAIDVVVADQYGMDAVESPMHTARILADEGAYLRHAELMTLYVARARRQRYDASFRDVLNFDDLTATLSSIKRLEGLRSKLLLDKDRYGLTAIREAVIRCKDDAKLKGALNSSDAVTRLVQTEIAEWLRVWLQTPGVFEGWVTLRQRSQEFRDKFGQI